EPRVLFDPIGVDVAERIPTHEVLMDSVVFGDGILRLRCRDLGRCLLQILAGNTGVQSTQGIEQARTDQNVVPGVAFAATGSDNFSPCRPPVERLGESFERVLFPVSLSESGHSSLPSPEGFCLRSASPVRW